MGNYFLFALSTLDMHSQRTILPLQKWTGYEANQPFQYELRIGGKSPRLSETWNQKEKKKKKQQQNFFSRVYLPFNAGIKLVGAELPSCWSSREKQVPICTLVWGICWKRQWEFLFLWIFPIPSLPLPSPVCISTLRMSYGRSFFMLDPVLPNYTYAASLIPCY